ncbi:phage tail tube protein [Amycolatopsis sp. lyj-112]|uniref:phage tail tube protein n=1 Tax=Amycolatopsis sp. lyj-112 TaxID=2789288 RepID=UPI0039783782
MANMIDQYINVKDESVYGTAVAANRSVDFNSEDFKGDYSNVIIASGLRAGEYAPNAKRVARNPKGATGSLEINGANQGVAFWFKHMLGNYTLGTTTSGVTTHTCKTGDTKGKSFTLQKNMVGSDGIAYTKTYQGVKVVGWEISNSVDEYMKIKLDLDGQKETLGAGAGPLASQAKNFGNSDNLKEFKFYEGVVNVGGSQVSVSEISIKGKKNLAAERYFLGTQLKKEPIQNGQDEITTEFKMEFEDLTQEQRVASALESGAQVSVSVTWTATEPEAGGGVSSITLTMPVVSLVDAPSSIDVGKLAEQSLTGNVLWPGSGQGDNMLTATIVTPDATAV